MGSTDHHSEPWSASSPWSTTGCARRPPSLVALQTWWVYQSTSAPGLAPPTAWPLLEEARALAVPMTVDLAARPADYAHLVTLVAGVTSPSATHPTLPPPVAPAVARLLRQTGRPTDPAGTLTAMLTRWREGRYVDPTIKTRAVQAACEAAWAESGMDSLDAHGGQELVEVYHIVKTASLPPSD